MAPCIRRTAWLGLFTLAGAALVLPAACGPPKAVGFSLDVPGDVQAKWLELGAFRGGKCSTLGPQLGGGVPRGYAARVAFSPEDGKAPPKFGSLPRDSYAFVGTARDENCKVVAIGCVESEVDDDVTLGLIPFDRGGGECSEQGTRCDFAQCLPVPGGGSLGEHCSIDFVGAGPFQVLNPDINGIDTGASAPAIVPTRDGFLIAYVEVVHDTGYSHVRVLHIGSNGALLSAGQEKALEISYPRCGSTAGDTSPLVAQMALDGKNGLLAIPHGSGACTPSGGIDFFPLTDGADDASPAKFTLGDPRLLTSAGNDVRFANGSRLAALGGGQFFTAYVDGATNTATTGVAGFDGVNFAPGAVTKILGAATHALTASSDAVLAIATVGAGSPVPIMDAGASDAGKVDAGPATGDAGAGTAGGSLALGVGDLTALPTALSYQTVATAGLTWSALAASGDKAAIAFGDAEGPHYALVGKGESATPVILPTNTLSEVPIANAVIALRQKRLFAATYYPSKLESGVFDASVSLVSIDTSEPNAAVREAVFGRLQSVPSVARMRGGQLAIAVSDSRVLVAWTTARSLTPQDGVGGYAMFACTE